MYGNILQFSFTQLNTPHTHTGTHAGTHTGMHTQACTHTHTHTHTHTQTHTGMHKHRHTGSHSQTHTGTHTLIHTFVFTQWRPGRILHLLMFHQRCTLILCSSISSASHQCESNRYHSKVVVKFTNQTHKPGYILRKNYCPSTSYQWTLI